MKSTLAKLLAITLGLIISTTALSLDTYYIDGGISKHTTTHIWTLVPVPIQNSTDNTLYVELLVDGVTINFYQVEPHSQFTHELVLHTPLKDHQYIADICLAYYSNTQQPNPTIVICEGKQITTQ